VALAREEEKGYARGLKDGKAMAVETVASNLGCPTCANFGRHYCPHHAE
jgi:hypothetical protein